MVLVRDVCYTDYSNKLARWCMVLASKTKEAKEKSEEKINKMSNDEEVYALYSACTKEEIEIIIVYQVFFDKLYFKCYYSNPRKGDLL